MSVINGVSKLVNKHLTIIKPTPAYDTASTPTALNGQVSAFKYLTTTVISSNNVMLNVTGQGVIDLKQSQIVKVVDEIAVFREENGTSIDVLFLIVEVTGQLENSDPAAGPILGVGSFATILYGLPSVQGANELDTSYMVFEGELAEQSNTTPSTEAEKENYVFLGDLQFSNSHSSLKQKLSRIAFIVLLLFLGGVPDRRISA